MAYIKQKLACLSNKNIIAIKSWKLSETDRGGMAEKKGKTYVGCFDLIFINIDCCKEKGTLNYLIVTDGIKCNFRGPQYIYRSNKILHSITFSW